MLNIVEQFPLRDFGRYSAEDVAPHRPKPNDAAYADRARYLGDPGFTEIPSHLTTKEHAKQLAATIDPNRATPSADVAPEIKLADGGKSTTHFSVVDAARHGRVEHLHAAKQLRLAGRRPRRRVSSSTTR